MADRKDQELDKAIEEFYFRIWEQAPMGKRDVLSLTNDKATKPGFNVDETIIAV